MAIWKFTTISIDGVKVKAQAPEIISASRSTDIPAFYTDWFFTRLKKGYSAWINPFNGVKSYVSYENTHFIIFWSKNPRPLLNYLDYLKEQNIGCYIQYTLNDYENDNLEPNVVPLAERIDTFKRLVDKLGKGHVIWRFDPLVLTEYITVENLLEKISGIGDKLKDFTEKLVFSYADIVTYKKVKNNLISNNIPYREWTEDEMHRFARGLAELNKEWRLELATCAEKVELVQYGIQHNHCVDDKLIVRLAYRDKKLMDCLGVDFYTIKPFHTDDYVVLPNKTYATIGNNKDYGQRKFCGCMKAKDIGEYNTCPHICEYCYANTNKASAMANYERHLANPFSNTITGR